MEKNDSFMSDYQVIARKYRPCTFAEILGQDAIVTTLKNGIKLGRLAHAYLFCGSRGTGKTTLARVFAKALNCESPTKELEPCCSCASCRDISCGHSLDVLEIDGASNRGIDDVRQINETVGYAASLGKYKIYIIDEVHMLTKEAFNALLKTLEEPPKKVKFFFATTEPHKVLPTILSRCQRFNLKRIPIEIMMGKLERIAEDMNYRVDVEALRIIASRAQGGLRDAESLLDQILAFHDTCQVTSEAVASFLGVMPQDAFFQLDQAGKSGNLAFAFSLAEQIFSEGKDLAHFLEMLTEHFRNILFVMLSGTDLLTCAEADKARYQESAKLYRKDQCLLLVDYLVDMQSKIRLAPFSRIALESILLFVLRSHYRIPVDIIVERLADLESKLQNFAESTPSSSQLGGFPNKKPPLTEKMSNQEAGEMTEDPTPSLEDLGVEKKSKATALGSANSENENPLHSHGFSEEERLETGRDMKPVSSQIPNVALREKKSLNESNRNSISRSLQLTPEKQQRYDTLLQFAAVELEGTVRKKPHNIKT